MFSKVFSRKYIPHAPSSARVAYSYNSGVIVSPDSAMQVSAFFSGVTYISTQIAKLPWHIKDSKNKIIDNDLSKILNLAPNPEMSAMSFKLVMVQTAIIRGNSYAEIERDMSGKVKNVWFLPTDSVDVTRINGKLWYRIVGGSTKVAGEDAFINPRDIFHIKNFYTKDGIIGQGVVAYGRETLGIALGADKLTNALVSNGGQPTGVLEFEGVLTEEAALRLKETWSKSHSGRNAGGTAVLEDGVTFKPTSIDPQVMQFLESRKFSVLEIARFLRIPPTKLYDSDTSSYNNIEHANLEVAVDTLDAWARNFENEADIKLLNMGAGGKKTEMDIYAIFRGDMETRANYFNKMMQSAAMTPNQIREREGMEPYEDGDRYYIANNNFAPVDRQDEIIDSQISNKNEKTPEEEKTEEVIANYLLSKTKK